MDKRDWIITEYDKRAPYLRKEPKSKNTRFDYQGAMEQELEKCRKDFEAGDKSAAMRAIYKSLKWGMTPPAWAKDYYVKAYEEKILTYQEKTWDKVLGRPYPKNLKLDAAKREQQMMHGVWLAVREEYQHGTTIDRNGEPKRSSIDVETFERVGEKFGIEKTLVSKYYYAYEKLLSEIDY